MTHTGMIDVGPQDIPGTGRIPVSPVLFGDVTQDSDGGPWLLPRVLVASAHRCSLLGTVLFVSLHLALTSDCSPRASSRGFFLFQRNWPVDGGVRRVVLPHRSMGRGALE